MARGYAETDSCRIARQKPMLIHGIFGAFALACVHIFAGRMRFLDRVPRSGWLSGAAGVSVSYVFIHLLPEVALQQQELRDSWPINLIGSSNAALFTLSLAGLLTFYGLERLSRHHPHDGENSATSTWAYWLHIGSFTLYNIIIGAALLEQASVFDQDFWLSLLAMALHFLVNDFSLQEVHQARYRRHGRWMLALAVFAGLGLAHTDWISEEALGVTMAFLAGGIVLNVLKEELPAEREAKFFPLLFGALGYASLLLLAT